MSSPLIWNGSYAKLLKDQLKLADTASILTGVDDPTSVAKNAPEGSIYLNVFNGKIYCKKDGGSSTNWKYLVDMASVGIANGVASLGPDGKVPMSQIPFSGLSFKGVWDATTNIPYLHDGTGVAGDFYRVTVAGSQDLGSGVQSFLVGDSVFYDGTVWHRSPATDSVISVNGYTGVVALNKTDIGLSGVPNVDCTNASNISSNTLNDARLSSNVTLQGNTFNGISQLVQTNGSGYLPGLNGSLLTNLTETDPLSLHLTGGTMTGNILFSASNTYDIGDYLGTYPRRIFAGGPVLIPYFTYGTFGNTTNWLDYGGLRSSYQLHLIAAAQTPTILTLRTGGTKDTPTGTPANAFMYSLSPCGMASSGGLLSTTTAANNPHLVITTEAWDTGKMGYSQWFGVIKTGYSSGFYAFNINNDGSIQFGQNVVSGVSGQYKTNLLFYSSSRVTAGDIGSNDGGTTFMRPLNVWVKDKINLDVLTANTVLTANANKDIVSTTTGTGVITALGSNTNAANGLIVADGSGKLPAIDGSALTNLPPGGMTQLTGEVTAGPGSGSQAATVTNSAVIGKVLTGLTPSSGAPVATDTILQAFNKLTGNVSNGLNATQIVVFPTNQAAFPSYGVQQFGTDLNAAWASIPRAGETYSAACSNWVVVIPANTYVPASNDLSITGTTVSTYGGIGVNVTSKIIDWGYNTTSGPIIGQTVTGPGIPVSTTISSIGTLSGAYVGTAAYTAGSPIVTSITPGAVNNMFVGMTVYSGSSQSYLQPSHILSIDSPIQITVSNNAIKSGSASMTTSPSCYAQLSNSVTSDNRDVQYSVNLPLTFTGTTNSSTSLTNCRYVCNEMVGQSITGTDIPGGTTVTAIAYNSTTNLGTITLSQAATGSTVGVTLSMPMPWLFYCDMTRKKIINIALGPVNLGKMYNGWIQGAQFWTPQPGSDHFIDLHLQLTNQFPYYSTRCSFAWSGMMPHAEANTTHEAYRAKSRLSGTLKFLDQVSALNSSCEFGDIEFFGNPAYTLYSSQTGTTHTSTLLDGLTSTAGLKVGQKITGTGIPSDTYIQGISTATSLVMTKAATNSASNTMTFDYVLPSTMSIDGTSVTTALNNYLMFYKARVRGTLNFSYNNAGAVSKSDIGNAESTEFSGLMSINGYAHIVDCAFKAGMVWLANDTAFDNYGIYNCQPISTASFNGTGSAALRMDGATNYWFVTAGSVLGTSTAKTIIEAVATSTENGILTSTDWTTFNSKASTNDLHFIPVRVATAIDYVASSTDYLVAVTNTSIPRSVTLPSSATVGNKFIIMVKDESGGAASNNITVQRAGSDTIDGTNSIPITANYGIVKVYTDGAGQWYTL